MVRRRGGDKGTGRWWWCWWCSCTPGGFEGMVRHQRILLVGQRREARWRHGRRRTHLAPGELGDRRFARHRLQHEPHHGRLGSRHEDKIVDRVLGAVRLRQLQMADLPQQRDWGEGQTRWGKVERVLMNEVEEGEWRGVTAGEK